MALEGVSNLEYLGSGMVVPFRIDASGDIDHGSGLRNLASSVHTLLGTQVGELPWKPGFGVGLYRLKHSNNDRLTEDSAGRMIAEAFARWEPRAVLIDVKVERAVEQGRMFIEVRYRPALVGEISSPTGVVLTEVVILAKGD